MEKKIQHLRETVGDEQLAHAIEKLGYGVNISTKRKKDIHTEGDHKIYINLRFENKNEFSLLASPNIRSMYNFGAKQSEEGDDELSMSQWVLYNSSTGDYYNDRIGLKHESKDGKPNGKYIIIECKKAGLELRDEYMRRKAGFAEISEIYGIDCEKYHCCDALVARVIAGHHLKIFHGWEHVTDEEAVFIKGAFCGQLIHCDTGVYEGVIKADVNSAYPFCMQSRTFRFPITIGTVMTIDDVNDIDKRQLGIYKLKVKGKHFLFRKTHNDYYTNYDITILDLLKIEYEVVKQKYNAIVWDEFLRGDVAFGYMNDLYELKRNGNKYVKGPMISTWGVLSQEKIMKISGPVTEEMKPFIRNYYPESNTAEIYMDKYLDRNGARTYKFATARIKPFMTSFMRLFMIKQILNPLLKLGCKIMQVNTDGFITDATPEQIGGVYPISKEMGALKIEKEYKKCRIENLINITEI